MRDIDELRPLTAGRLLTLWRAYQDTEPLERALLCNAQVLAESCFSQGEPAFESGEDVLAELTGRQMESLLRTLAGGGQPRPAGKNPSFDQERFLRLKGE